MSASANPDIVTDGLVLCLDAADSKSYGGSGTTWTDRSGNNKHGNLTNGPTYTTDDGGLLDFDGVNDYVTIGGTNNDNAWTADNSLGSDILCLEIWVKGSDSYGRIISKPWNGSGKYNISVYPNVFKLVVGTGVSQASDASSSISLPGINDGQWHHLVVWANSTNMGYYIDGGSSSNSQAHGLTGGVSNNGNSGLPLGLMTLYFYGGSWSGNTGHAFEGKVAVFRKYSKVLTAAEVLQNYNATKSRFGL